MMYTAQTMTEKVEEGAVQSPLEQCSILVEQKQVYHALLTWFQLPIEQRNELLVSTLQKASRSEMLSFAKDADDCTRIEHFVLQYFSTLSCLTAGKLLVPTGAVELSEEEKQELADSVGSFGYNRFHEIRMEKRFELDADSDTSDFPPPVSTFKRFLTEEMETFLMRLIPHLETESDLLRANFLIHPIQHIDLLANAQLFSRLENSLLFERMPMQDILANLLNQGLLPKAETFEAIFKRVPKECDPDVAFAVLDKKISISLFYFTFLLRAADVEYDNDHETTASTRGHAIDYLLNDEFMKRVLPYFESKDLFKNKMFGWDIIPKRLLIEYGDIIIEATGEEAKRLKGEQFSKILNTAIKHLQEEGDLQTIRELKEKFSDYVDKNSSY